ncbi:hypothetical protein PSP6_60105 [Paraburkholderia tropica]|nr:hypothetical protein PSP6_60105 [Paraburkholderia tropica]
MPDRASRRRPASALDYINRCNNVLTKV